MGGSRRLRVAHVITRMIVGGAQETVLLAASLADTGRFEPVVVCGPQTGSEGSLHGELTARGVEVRVVPQLVRQVDPRKDLLAVRSLVRVFHDVGADVVHTNSSKAGILGRIAAHRAGVPRVLHTVHGWPFHDRQAAAVSALWKHLERRAAPLAHRLVVVADTDRAKGLAAGIGTPEQYVTVRSGLELSLYRADAVRRATARAELGLPAGAVVLGAVNRLSRQKDPLTLVRAAAAVLRARPQAWLLLVGDGPMRGQVDALVDELGVRERVVLPGLRDDVPSLLSAMDVFLTASLWEGLPRTVVQAMATGVPVVATSADGIVDVVRPGQTGLLVPRSDPEALAAAAMRLVDDPTARTAFARAATARLPDFDAVSMTRSLEALYDGSGP